MALLFLIFLVVLLCIGIWLIVAPYLSQLPVPTRSEWIAIALIVAFFFFYLLIRFLRPSVAEREAAKEVETKYAIISMHQDWIDLITNKNAKGQWKGRKEIIHGLKLMNDDLEKHYFEKHPLLKKDFEHLLDQKKNFILVKGRIQRAKQQEKMALMDKNNFLDVDKKNA